MQIKDILLKKRNGGELSADELKTLLQSYLKGDVKDYQMAAWLMAVYFRGLSPEETREWTRLMWQSGRTFPRKDRAQFWVDKHSTGGVGDKTSLILVPLFTCMIKRLAKWDARIPMVSGRGLGHTGGTLDKLESVPGFSPNISFEQAASLLERNHFFMMGQTDEMAPGDRLLYALRDVTATVDSIPLIVSSIMSKKLSENLDGLVFDVKVGSGAFMRDLDSARNLSTVLRDVAKSQGLRSVAVLTRMDEPLGLTVGNMLEVYECAEFLEGHRRESGLSEVTQTLAAWMLHLATKGEISFEDARSECEKELAKPQVFESYRLMYEAQGGRWSAFEAQWQKMESEVIRLEYKASKNSWIRGLRADEFGKLATELGGGRQSKEDKIHPGVGLLFEKKSGDYVRQGETILTVYHDGRMQESDIQSRVSDAVQLDEDTVDKEPWILETLYEE